MTPYPNASHCSIFDRIDASGIVRGVAFFVIMRGHGPSWDDARPMREQDRWPGHAAFMDDLAGEGFVVMGGPIDQDDSRIMLIVEAAEANEVRARLEQDPWSEAGLLVLTGVEPWQVLLTGSQLSVANEAQGSGVGRALLDAVKALARRTDVQEGLFTEDGVVGL